jgi:hypothetical protein
LCGCFLLSLMVFSLSDGRSILRPVDGGDGAGMWRLSMMYYWLQFFYPFMHAHRIEQN